MDVKKAKEPTKSPVPLDIPEEVVVGDRPAISPESAAPAGPLCECGKPVAEGQTYVCKDHVRRG